MPTKPCGRQTNFGLCHYPRMAGKQRCRWHWLAAQPADVQAKAAESRLESLVGDRRARVPSNEWPPAERWCSGCQSFVPLFYTTGSRCKACASVAAHSARVEKVYGITPEEYDALFKLQGGRCFICQRRPRSKRLAVDHDHETGAVRGLLCPDSRRGCNHAILGNIKDLAMAKRIVLYLEWPPYDRLRGIPKGQAASLGEEDVKRSPYLDPPF